MFCGLEVPKWLRESRSRGIYAPLDRSRREIRLLHLLPGLGSSPIKCHLSTVSLDDEPTYEALSYVWGNRKYKKRVRLGDRSFRIRRNLLSALKTLRGSDTSRVMWIDALCINQDDPDERSQQVMLMGEVLRSAQKVIAWLGLSLYVGQPTFDFLKVLGESPELHLDARLSPHLDVELLEPETIRSLMQLFDCDWWERVWTLQEMILATRLEFRCGSYSLRAETLAAANTNFWSHQACCFSAIKGEYPGDPLADLDTYFARLSRIYGYADLEEADFDFSAIMTVFQQRKCTDPRDKVFGYLGLAVGSFRNYIEPNYLKRPSAVFEETALRIMEMTEWLSPFSLLEGPRIKSLRIPSWVPTWQEFDDNSIFEAFYIRFKWLPTFDAHREKPIDLVHVCPGTKVKVRGVRVDRVGQVGRVPPSHPIKHQTAIYDEWHTLARCASSAPYRDGASTREEVFWLTLLNGSLHEDDEYPDLRAGHEESVNLPAHGGEAASFASPERNESEGDPVRKIGESSATIEHSTSPVRKSVDSSHWHRWWAFMHSASDFLDDEGLTFNTCVTAATLNRSFLTTVGDEGGYMGTGPAATRPEDLIVVLYGGWVPYVLRRTGTVTTDRDGTMIPDYTILGDCYVHGIMHGAAIDMLDTGIDQEQSFVLV